MVRTRGWLVAWCAALVAASVGLAGPRAEAAGRAASTTAATPTHPVTPRVQKIAVSGVDRAALAAQQQGLAASSSAQSQRTTPRLLTAVLPAQRFNVVGITWDAASTTGAVSVLVRVREGAVWTGWQSLAADDLHADPGSVDERHAAGRGASEILRSSGADALQVRLDTADGATPTNVQAVLIDSEPVAADAVTAAASAAAVSAPAPWIITRAGWGADESLKTCVADTNSTVQLGFVHHTVNANTYSADEVPSLVRAIYAFHVQGRGWCDVGYNFLVDRFGRVFEGRYGGVDRGVVGAHTGGFNSLSFGVATIGNFSEAQPPTAMVSSVNQVLAWKLSLYGRDPKGLVTVVSGGSDRFPAGTVVTLNVISGHRDTWATDCPGSFLYPLLPSMRNAVADIINRAHSPIGHLDSVKAIPGGLAVSGWALDPDSTSWIYAWVTVGGTGGPVFASVDRPDVAAAFPGRGGTHGFFQTYPLPPGGYRVCAWGVNTGPGLDAGFGCVTATVGGPPQGNLEVVRPIPGGMFIAGWTFDPDTAASIYAWVDISGRGFPLSASIGRPDVAAAYFGYGGQHGFQVAIPAGPGTYRVCAAGVNVGAGSDAYFGCRSVTVT